MRANECVSAMQISLFDTKNDRIDISAKSVVQHDKEERIILTEEITAKLLSYNLETYLSDIATLGLKTTWDYICEFVLTQGICNAFLSVPAFGELYEIGLAVQNKTKKKKRGQYYTPDDVATVMGNWLTQCAGDAVCDVACGTGKLILTYLDLIGYDEAKRLINSGKVYLYDIDRIALKICKTAIILKYSIENPRVIHDIHCDFLDRSIALPVDCKVIANPPYAAIENIGDCWERTDVLLDTKELYAVFMEKIFSRARSAVVITPFSFISGNKFYSLREKMCKTGNGSIVSFDNVPGNIFYGRKHGIFNTNTANSVRAAITVFYADSTRKGFQISPLIRFKNTERKDVLATKVLEDELPEERQLVCRENPAFRKIDKRLTEVYTAWVKQSNYKIKNVLQEHSAEFLIDMPNTCRYFTTASHRKLKRSGSITLYVEDADTFYFLYCFINSSFAYWWWRIYDGGITYPSGLLKDMPVPLNLLSDADKAFFKQLCLEMIEKEKEYIITKKNAGAVQENIKFPKEYRRKINARILSILGCKCNLNVLDSIHANQFCKRGVNYDNTDTADKITTRNYDGVLRQKTDQGCL